MFYTGKPLYNELMHEIHANYLALNAFEDKMTRSGISTPPPEAMVDLSDSTWIGYEAFKNSLLERIKEDDFKYMIQSMENLMQHPYSARIREFFMKYRIKRIAVTSQLEILPITYDEDGRPYAEALGN